MSASFVERLLACYLATLGDTDFPCETSMNLVLSLALHQHHSAALLLSQCGLFPFQLAHLSVFPHLPKTFHYLRLTVTTPQHAAFLGGEVAFWWLRGPSWPLPHTQEKKGP